MTTLPHSTNGTSDPEAEPRYNFQPEPAPTVAPFAVPCHVDGTDARLIRLVVLGWTLAGYSPQRMPMPDQVTARADHYVSYVLHGRL